MWGRIDNGEVRLQPAIELSAPARLPTRSGRYAVEGLDAHGTVLFSYSFDGEQVANQSTDMRQFAFVIPFQGQRAEQLARLRVRGGTDVAEWISPSAIAAQGSGAAAMRAVMPVSGPRRTCSVAAGHGSSGTRRRIPWPWCAMPRAARSWRLRAGGQWTLPSAVASSR